MTDVVDGTMVPGMMWGILWFYMCWRKGLACYGVPLLLGLGIALGGELGGTDNTSLGFGAYSTLGSSSSILIHGKAGCGSFCAG